MSPAVSVVMPVYNGEKYLRQALESVLRQTFHDFEFIILDDGSIDKTHAILEEFALHDARVHLYKNRNNLGLSRTLNRGLELARSEYIARMDADDICLPERLEKQVQYMQTHLEIDICGSWAQLIGEQKGQILKYPCAHDEIYAKMLFVNALVHPSVIMRASAIREHGLYYDIAQAHIEDYDLWSRALPLVRFANIPEPLLQYRLHGANTANLHGAIQRERRAHIYERFLSHLDIECAQYDLALHEQIGSNQYGSDITFLQRTREWLIKIDKANKKTGLISANTLKAELGQRWTQACQISQVHPLSILFEILYSPLRFRKRKGLFKFWSGIKFSLDKIV